jgi:peptidoglycan/LPS O-acetylase OafA/YrhL
VQRPLIHNVQVLRFIAAAGVVLSHQADLLIPHDAANAWFWAMPWTAGVHLFFVISGFVMLLLTHQEFGEKGAAAKFLKRRFIRIVPPYWFFTTVTAIAVLAAGGRLGGTTVDVPQLLTSYSFLPWPRFDGQLKPIMAQGWTLNYEAFFYLAFAAALLTRRGLIAFCAAFVLLALSHPFVRAPFFVLRFWTDPIILEFLGGILLAKLYLSGLRISLFSSCGLAGLAAVIFVMTSGTDAGFFTDFLHVGVPAILVCGCLMLAPAPRRIGWVGRMLQRGGDASYTIYLAHYLIVHATALTWRYMAPGWPWLGVLVGMALAIGTATIFYFVAERPVTRALQGPLRRRPAELEAVAP